jgi:hypothetical protein
LAVLAAVGGSEGGAISAAAAKEERSERERKGIERFSIMAFLRVDTQLSEKLARSRARTFTEWWTRK